ncbi:MAG: NYN domain-containing protein, partial [bacterium]
MTNERVVVFIDGSNFYHGLHGAFGKANVEYHQLGRLLAGQRELVQVYYYVAPLNENMGKDNFINQQRFLEHLRRTPKVTVRLGRFSRRETKYDVTCSNLNCGEDFILRKVAYVERGVDVYLVVDMIRFAYENLYDVGVL